MRHDAAIPQRPSNRHTAATGHAGPLGLAAVLLLAAGQGAPAAAQDSETEGGGPEKVARGRVIVTSPDAKLQIADRPPRPVPTGRILDYSRTNGAWLWVDELWGWVDSKSVMLLPEAEASYTKALSDAEADEKALPGETFQPAGDLTAEQQRDRKAAAIRTAKSIALHQRGIVRYAAGRPGEAVEDFDAAIAGGYKLPNVHINRGNALLANGDFDAAVEAITEAIAIDPRSARGYYSRAAALITKDFFEAALGDADKAVELDPNAARHWYIKGQAERSLGKFAEAVKSFNEAIKLSPRYVEALTNRGYSLKRLGRLEQAAKDYRQAIEVDPELAVSRNDLAWLLATTKDEGLRDAEEAVTLAEAAVELAGGEAGADLPESEVGQYYDTLAAAYAAAQSWEDAEKAARKAVELLDGADQFAADERLTMYLNKKPYVEK